MYWNPSVSFRAGSLSAVAVVMDAALICAISIRDTVTCVKPVLAERALARITAVTESRAGWLAALTGWRG